MTAAPDQAPVVSVRERPRMALYPVEARRVLRFELEWLFVETGVTHATVASWLGVSRASVTQALAGKNLLSQPAIEVVCNRLGRMELFQRLASLLTAARGRGTAPAGIAGHAIPRDTDLVLGLEAFAEQVTVFDPWLVPPHLQTQTYADALTAPDDTQHETRERRQSALTDSDDSLDFLWVTTEHVLHRRVGSPSVMRAQLAHLVEMGERENVCIRVIPATADTLVDAGGSFQLIWGTPPVMVEYGRLAVHHTHDAETVAYFAHLLDNVQRQALDPGASLALISGLLP
ncbi:DUF5753 domain-containing protein [Actinokineospora sp. 24-640]